MEQYIGEIRMFCGNYAPLGWAFCDGTLLDIANHEALFALIGTTFGGNGQTTFALPDLRGRLPIHLGQATSGTTYSLGQSGGTESVTLTVQQLPSHTHRLNVNSQSGSLHDPTGAVVAGSAVQEYSTNSPTGTMNTVVLSGEGGNQPHDNIMPFLALNFIICLEGMYPSQG